MINSFKSRLYYRGLDIILYKKMVGLPSKMRQKKNLFLYFDYEREFGGHKTDISDKHIIEILDLLGSYNIKATWFTVGQIFSQYPKSIREILSSGHELASHTFYHKGPYHYKKKDLKKDFEQVFSAAPTNIKGFHSPNGKWSFSLLKLLNQFNYDYDVLSAKHQKQLIPFRHTLPGINKTLRLYTVGDDWGLYDKKISSDEVFFYFKNLYSQIKTGHVAGIGAHPWVLYSNTELLEGYSRFLLFISSQNDVVVNTAANFVSKLK